MLRVVAAACAAAAVATVAAVFLGGSETGIAPADTLVRIDPNGGKPAGLAAVDTQPTAVTVCAGNVWVTGLGGRVSQIDPRLSTLNRIRVVGTPSDVADIGDLAAVVTPAAVTIIDAQFGEVSGKVPLRVSQEPVSGAAVAFGRDIWVANPSARELERLDPPFTQVAEAIPLGGRPRFIAAGEGALWAAGGRMLWRVDMGRAGGRVRIKLPFAPAALAAGYGGVWLVDKAAARLVRIDPKSRQITARIRVGRSPQAVAVGFDSVWVANNADGTVSRIDAHGNVVERTYGVRSAPVDLAVGLGSVWVVRRTAS